MKIKLMSLRLVPDDEITEITDLLTENNIDFYFTEAGSFGISPPILWLSDDNQKIKAQQLLTEYQKNRASTARQLYLSEKSAGKTQTMLNIFYQDPIKFILYILAILFFIYLLLLPALLIN